jgi:predicted Zn-dependent peptidase
VTAEELVQAKNKVLARAVLRSERPMGRLASLGFHWMYRHAYLSVEDELEAFNKVTVEDLRRLLQAWPLWPLTIVSVGPTTEVHAPE